MGGFTRKISQVIEEAPQGELRFGIFNAASAGFLNETSEADEEDSACFFKRRTIEGWRLLISWPHLGGEKKLTLRDHSRRRKDAAT